jgi:phospholipase/lecithinase/hemolysin
LKITFKFSTVKKRPPIHVCGTKIALWKIRDLIELLKRDRGGNCLRDLPQETNLFKEENMNKNIVKRQRLTLICLFTFSLAILCASRATAEPDFDGLVVFGTSLSDPGNLFALLGGVNVPPSYDFEDPLLVPTSAYAIGGHHLSNGDTWIEQLAKQLRMSRSALPAFRDANPYAMNYAIAGTRAGPTAPIPVLTFEYQVSAFLDDVGGVAPSNKLYVIEIGVNDVRDALIVYLTCFAGGGTEAVCFDAAIGVLDAALKEIQDQVGILQGAGANKFFYLNVAKLGVLPSIKTLDFISGSNGAVIALANNLAQYFNGGLQSIFANVPLLNVYDLSEKIVSAPEDYGLTNAEDACVTPNVPPYKCQNPNGYLFWDGVHPTKAGHAIFADAAAAALNGE